jgi:hypothetical protein
MRHAVLHSSVEIVTDGIILWLDASQLRSYSGSGSTWTDLTTKANNGTLNGTTFNSGNGGHIAFNGTSDRVTFSLLTDMNTDYGTYEIWLKSDVLTSAAAQVIFGRSGTNVNAFAIRKNPTGLITGSLVNNNNTIYAATGDSISTTAFAYYAITFDGTSFILYQNGSLRTTTTTVTSTISTAGTLIVTLASRTDNALHFDGNIAIARAYNRALSSTEIAQNYNAEKSRFGL